MGAMATVVELFNRILRPDAQGRITGSGPHLHVLLTKDAVLCRCHADLSDEVVEALQRTALVDRGRQRDWPHDYGRYLNILASVGAVRAIRSGMLYCVRDPPEGAAIRVTAANADLLRHGLDEWLPDIEAGRLIYASVVDGRAASICASVREADGVHAAGVETLPSHRRRGLAADAVAAWAGAVLRMGAIPLYGTTFDNLASQGVARSLGMELVGSEFSVECELINRR
jgi:GNAT superfamily N-acetyltransferase